MYLKVEDLEGRTLILSDKDLVSVEELYDEETKGLVTVLTRVDAKGYETKFYTKTSGVDIWKQIRERS